MKTLIIYILLLSGLFAFGCTKTATEWTTGGTRTGNGNVTISGLSAGTYYVMAYSTLAGVIGGGVLTLKPEPVSADQIAEVVRQVIKETNK